jgi:hypothetical protein
MNPFINAKGNSTCNDFVTILNKYSSKFFSPLDFIHFTQVMSYQDYGTGFVVDLKFLTDFSNNLMHIYRIPTFVINQVTNMLGISTTAYNIMGSSLDDIESYVKRFYVLVPTMYMDYIDDHALNTQSGMLTYIKTKYAAWNLNVFHPSTPTSAFLVPRNDGTISILRILTKYDMPFSAGSLFTVFMVEEMDVWDTIDSELTYGSQIFVEYPTGENHITDLNFSVEYISETDQYYWNNGGIYGANGRGYPSFTDLTKMSTFSFGTYK